MRWIARMLPSTRLERRRNCLMTISTSRLDFRVYLRYHLIYTSVLINNIEVFPFTKEINFCWDPFTGPARDQILFWYVPPSFSLWTFFGRIYISIARLFTSCSCSDFLDLGGKFFVVFVLINLIVCLCYDASAPHQVAAWWKYSGIRKIALQYILP